MMLKLNREQIIDFIILSLRWYLAYYMADYGWSKLIDRQFGLHDNSLLDKPLRELDKFQIAWHLFSLDKTFNIVVGLTQILGAILIVINRTAILGAIFLLPVLGQIFLVDLAFTTNVFGLALPLRLGGMILADLFILYYYKDKVVNAFRHITTGITTKFKYKWWVFILLPVIGLLMDFVISILTMPIKWLIIWLTR